MYTKLPVSSLESRAETGDLKACAELKTRADSGLKRARLAIQRLLDCGESVIGCKQWATMWPILFPESIPDHTPATPKLTAPQSACNHTHYDFDCPTCITHWNKSFEPLINEAKGQIERTAQQIFDETRGK